MEFFKVILYYPFLNLLTLFVWLVPGHNVIWGIILLTLLVRFALLVPSRKQAESQRKMQQVNPLLEELKREYGKDREGLAKAQMQLYKDHEINPFSSCLVLLIQFPVLIILNYAILHGLDASSPHLYSWIPRPETIHTMLFGIDLLKPDPTFIFPIVTGVVQFFAMQQALPVTARLFKKRGTAGSTAPADPMMSMQRNMGLLMPFFIFFVARGLPAAMAVYWTISTLFTIVQQHSVNRRMKLKTEPLPLLKKEAKEVIKEVQTVPKTESKKGGVKVTVRKKS